MADDKYISDQQQRLLDLIRNLAGNEVEGLAPSQIAKANGCLASQVTRDLANLKHAGWAEQITTTGRWRLGSMPVQIGIRHMAAMDKAQRKLDETKARFSLGTPEAAATSAHARFSTLHT